MVYGRGTYDIVITTNRCENEKANINEPIKMNSLALRMYGGAGGRGGESDIELVEYGKSDTKLTRRPLRHNPTVLRFVVVTSMRDATRTACRSATNHILLLPTNSSIHLDKLMRVQCTQQGKAASSASENIYTYIDNVNRCACRC